MGAEETIRSFFRGFERRDETAMLTLTTADLRFEPLSTEVATRDVYEGHAGFHSYLEDLATTWDEFSVSATAYELHGERALVLGRVYARSERPAFVADRPLMFVFELRDGLIARVRVFETEAEARAAVGGGTAGPDGPSGEPLP